MSPLVDVTNTVSQDSTPDSPHTGSLRKSRVRVPNFFQRVPDVHSQGEVNIKYGKELRVKSEAVAITMCNTQVSSPIGHISSFQGFPTIAHLYRCMASPVRVPPLPQTADVFLSQAVQALSLSSHRTQTKPHTRKHFSRQSNGSSDLHEHKSKKLVSSCSGLPENSGSSIATSALQQCGACGLKFTSLPVLTQHLTRHVYEGLHAAQWLTQAMGLVSSRQSTVESDLIDQVDHVDDTILTSSLNNQLSHSGD